MEGKEEAMHTNKSCRRNHDTNSQVDFMNLRWQHADSQEHSGPAKVVMEARGRTLVMVALKSEGLRAF